MGDYVLRINLVDRGIIIYPCPENTLKWDTLALNNRKGLSSSLYGGNNKIIIFIYCLLALFLSSSSSFCRAFVANDFNGHSCSVTYITQLTLNKICERIFGVSSIFLITLAITNSLSIILVIEKFAKSIYSR